MAHRGIVEALGGLLLGLFVAMISSTIVTNALPTIVADLGGRESTYTCTGVELQKGPVA